MDWLLTLFQVDPPAGATVRSVDWAILGNLSPWAVIAIWSIATAASFGLYRSERGRVGRSLRGTMTLLRSSAIGLLLLLLLRPVVVFEFEGDRPRGVVLLVDDSASMTLRDRRSTSEDRVRAAIALGVAGSNLAGPSTSLAPEDLIGNPSRGNLVRAVLSNDRLDLIPKLKRLGPLRSYTFAGRSRRLPDGMTEFGDDDARSRASEGRELRVDASRTALADAIVGVLSRGDGDLPAAIVAMTDGLDNASKIDLADAARECARLEVPLHIYGVGATGVGNLQLKDLSVPETIFHGDTVAIPVRWSCRGFSTGLAEITLRLGTERVARKEVDLREGDDLRETLLFTPRGRGEGPSRSELIATIRHLGEEPFTQDNELRRPVRLIDARVRVLYIEGEPRWEFKFLQTALLRDRRVEPRFVLVEGDPRSTSHPPFSPSFPTSRHELFGFDLLIVGDVAAESIGAERLAWVRDFVAEGGGLVAIAGRRHAPAEYRATALAEVLPIEFDAAKFNAEPSARVSPFTPMLTAAGARSDMMGLADDPDENLRIWAGLPGFHWNYPVTRLRAAASALLAHPTIEMAGAPMPLMAIQPYGKGMSLFLGGDETWRWRRNSGDRDFARFWGQVVSKMGLTRRFNQSRRVELALGRKENLLGRPGRVRARVFDAEFRPLTSGRIAATLKWLDDGHGVENSRPLSLEAVPDQPGEFQAQLPNDAVGRFVLTVAEPEAASLEYRVDPPPDHEMDVADMAETALLNAARISGGRFYREEDLQHLISSIAPRSSPFVRRQDVGLWNLPAFLLFVAILTAEWTLRKLSNLS